MMYEKCDVTQCAVCSSSTPYAFLFLCSDPGKPANAPTAKPPSARRVYLVALLQRLAQSTHRHRREDNWLETLCLHGLGLGALLLSLDLGSVVLEGVEDLGGIEDEGLICRFVPKAERGEEFARREEGQVEGGLEVP